MNLIEMLMKNFSPDLLAKLAPMLGISPEQAKSGIEAAVPSVLGGLLGSSNSAAGAQKLNDAVDQADPDALDGMMSTLSGGNIADLSSKGTGLLDGLLGGGSSMSGLATVLAKFTGLPAGVVTTILGLLTPALLGGIKKASGVSGLSPSALLSSQKDNITNALPPGLGSMLGSVPGLGFAPPVMSAPVNSAPVISAPAKSGGSGFLLPLAALVAAAGVAYWYFNRDNTAVLPMPENPTSISPNVSQDRGAVRTDALPDVQPDVLPDVQPDMSSPVAVGLENAKAAIGSLTSELGNINDVASAEAALPKLREIAGNIDSLEGLTRLIPADAKSSFTGPVAALVAPVRANAVRLYAIPGVGDKLKPVLDPILAKLEALSK